MAFKDETTNDELDVQDDYEDLLEESLKTNGKRIWKIVKIFRLISEENQKRKTWCLVN